MKLTLATTEAEIEATAHVMNELRTDYQLEDLIKAIKDQMQQGYQLLSVELDGEVVGAAGFVMTRKLAWKKHIYVDDLITSSSVRSKGVGQAMLDWLKDYGKANGCEQLHLDSGVQRFDAHRFYLRHGFAINSHHFGMTL